MRRISFHASVVLLAFFDAVVCAEGLERGVPTSEQIAWHEMEMEMFLCLDPCTWQGREYDDHSVGFAMAMIEFVRRSGTNRVCSVLLRRGMYHGE